MQTLKFITAHGDDGCSFDLFRLSKSKQSVDLAPNTLRAYHKRGLRFYRQGKAVFVSKSELQIFIRSGDSVQQETLYARQTGAV